MAPDHGRYSPHAAVTAGKTRDAVQADVTANKTRTATTADVTAAKTRTASAADVTAGKTRVATAADVTANPSLTLGDKIDIAVGETLIDAALSVATAKSASDSLVVVDDLLSSVNTVRAGLVRARTVCSRWSTT